MQLSGSVHMHTHARGSPGQGQVGDHAKPADHARRLQAFQFTEDMHAAIDTTMDHTWILLAGLLCWFLQGGFALLEAGAVRAKNAKNIALKNTMDACVGGVVYYCFGYCLAYGSPGDGTGNPFSGGELSGACMLSDVGFGEYCKFYLFV